MLEGLFDPGVAWEFCRQRDGACWACDGDGIVYLHHAVYRRSDVQGWQPRERRALVDCAANCIVLCGGCHETPREPDRLTVARWMLDRYGQPWLEWARGLPFKLNPLRVWLAKQEG